MGKNKYPITAAIRTLRQHRIPFESHLYDYQEKGGTRVSAQALGVDEHAVIKTLVMEDENKKPLIVLMHGDCNVSTKNLARQIGVKSVAPCAPAVADRHSGYQVGGTSPFGTHKTMPIYAQKSIFDLERIFINGGKRGYLVSMAPQEALAALHAQAVDVIA